jgi:hypothetical protein
VKEVIKDQQCGKSPGVNNIPAEIIKTEDIWELVTLIWHTEELLERLKMGLIYSTHIHTHTHTYLRKAID